MAPPRLELVARTIETDPAFMLLYFALRHTEDGKINFDKVAMSMGLDTGNAAKKRYARLIKVQDEGVNGGFAQNETTKPRATPQKGRGKKKGGDAEENGGGVGDDSPSPTKKQRVTNATKAGTWKASLEDDDEDKDAVHAKGITTVKQENRLDRQIDDEDIA